MHDAPRELTQQAIVDALSEMFWRAFQAAPFDVLCAVLRVSGMQDANWDPLEESKEAFEDFNSLLRLDQEVLSEKGRWRIGLLMYCHAVEMTAPQEFLANLLRAINGEKYHVRPFGSLGRSNKNKPFSWVPPSAPTKYRELKRLATAVGEEWLIDHIDCFLFDEVRNAFSHSDYVLTDEYFRWTEGGIPQQVELDTVNRVILNCFRFVSAILWLHAQVLADLRTLPKYHKWPNYEVLELLSDGEKLYGFQVHFSNGSRAKYARDATGVDCVNMLFEPDGSINFMVGCLDDLRPEWKIDGKPYDEMV